MFKPANTQEMAGKVIEALENWRANYAYDQGKILDQQITFRLPGNGAHQIDAGWINKKDWQAAKMNSDNDYPAFCPDFIVKFSEPEPHTLDELKTEMTKFRDFGCSLGWLIEPENEQVFIFKPREQVHQIPTFDYYLDGRDVLKGFEFPLKRLRY